MPGTFKVPGTCSRDQLFIALQNIDEAIQLWVETAEEFGDPIPEPKGRKLMYA